MGDYVHYSMDTSSICTLLGACSMAWAKVCSTLTKKA